jgi:DNA-binding transcriptional LysR family regulator
MTAKAARAVAERRGISGAIDDKHCLLVQLHRLEGFYWVARTGGYAAAARAFPYPLTQPAVYQQVRKLEEDLGVPLFERAPRGRRTDGVRLTAAGRHLLQFASPFFEQLPAVVRAVKAGTHGGELRMGAEALVLHRLLPEWLHRLHRRLPEVRVDVRELAAPHTEPVESGALDLAVAYFPSALPPTLRARAVAALSASLVLPARHALAGRRQVDLRALGDDTFVGFNPGTLHHDLQLRALARAGIVPRRMLSASTTEAILGLVAAGIGYSLVPSLSRADLRRPGLVARPFGGDVAFPVLAIWRATATVNPAIEAALATAPRCK